MQRVPEPELMDEETQARAYSEADFQAPHEHFVDLLCASLPGQPAALTGPVLDLGCGPADVTVRVATRCPRVVVHGVDGSAAMLALGEARVREARLSSRVVLSLALLPRDRPPLAQYPVVISNSLLHHLHDPAALWTTVKTFGAAGGHLFIMDLLRPPDVSEVERLVALHTRGEPAILVRDFHASLCAAFTADEVRTQLEHAGLAQLKVEVVSDRHLTISGALPHPHGATS